jgi:hypothetical protein
MRAVSAMAPAAIGPGRRVGHGPTGEPRVCRDKCRRPVALRELELVGPDIVSASPNRSARCRRFASSSADRSDSSPGNLPRARKIRRPGTAIGRRAAGVSEADDHEVGSRAPPFFQAASGTVTATIRRDPAAAAHRRADWDASAHTTLSGLRAASTSRLCDGVALDPTEAPTLRDDIAAANLVLVIKGAATRVRPRPLPSSIARPDG